MTERGDHDPDRELDEALASLHLEARMSDRSLDDARERLMAEASSASAPASFPTRSPFRRRGLVVGVAAAAVAIVGGAVAFGGSGKAPEQQPAAQSAQPTTSQQPVKRDVSLLSAAQVLNDTADKITAKDLDLKPGQYRFIEVKATYASSTINGVPQDSTDPETGYTYLVDSTNQTWIPQDVTQDWLEKRIPGKAEYLASSMPKSEVPAYEFSDVQSGERRGACGDFFPKAKPKKVCGDTTDFGQPAFYEALPRDPDQLVTWLTDYTAQRGSAPTTMFHFGVQFLTSGVMPADLRGPFLRAMAKIDGVKVVEEATTSDGRKGIALGIGDERERRDLIVDPDNGEIIGERAVAADKPDSSWIKPGTVTSSVSLTIKIADAIGVVPAN
ncbi:CU044_5270 family protein [Umezawaea endophytica]|uniref:CU044_5270 family protein n=1 Tax=Umezawaea endophytica TaxID=1654476 RepID=A0A9X2VR07_9PSEU|nr:CU044_5270 family protein [Umezawaea endophytica]MCS7481024.1 CU044_5270 family protein [Umezawaea endophytica]